MTITRQHALTLPANPRAVKLARVWVGQVLHEIGRDDLADSAELGVSELVTNAIMHSAPPVAVRLRGTRAHPRIEVADCSQAPPRPRSVTAGEDDVLATFGRGLALVAVHSKAWGADLDQDGHGKTVWFEPVTEPDDSEMAAGDLFDIDDLLAERGEAVAETETIEITLIATPVTAFVDLLRHYAELRRELRLLALTNPERYPLAVRFSDVAARVERDRRRTTGVEQELAAAVKNGAEQVDLVVRAPDSAPETMGALRDLLEEVHPFLEQETLLAADPPPRLLEVQHWYLEQYVDQGSGASPIPWSGGYATS